METNKQPKPKIKLPTRVQPEVMPQPGEIGIYTNKIHYLRKYLLDELATKKFAMDFMEPVDTTALQVPNYYTVIKKPMDVGTIIKRVQNRYYHRVDDLICDFRLVISNCFQFNRPGDVVYRNCLKLEKFFHRVLNKMPKGDEKPSTKDPCSTSKQHSCEKTTATVQRQCHEHLRKLKETLAQEEDQCISKYFNAKIEYLSQKVDRFHFKTMEEFRFEVTSIFKNFDNQVITLHEVFHKTCEEDQPQRQTNCHWSQEDYVRSFDIGSESINLDKRDITEVLHALKRAENSVDHCVKSYSKQRENCARNLINIFDNSASKLKEKLMRGRTVHTSREYRQLVLAEEAERSELFEEENSLKSQDDAGVYSPGDELLDLDLDTSQELDEIDDQGLDEPTDSQKETPTDALSSPFRSSYYPNDASPSTVFSQGHYEPFESYDTPMVATSPEIDVVAVDDVDTAPSPTTAVFESACSPEMDGDSAAYGPSDRSDDDSAAAADYAESDFAMATAEYSVFTAVPGLGPPVRYCGSGSVTPTGANYDSTPVADSDSDTMSAISADLDSDTITLGDFDYASGPATEADYDAECDPISDTATAEDVDWFPANTPASAPDIEFAFLSDTPPDPESDPPPVEATAMHSVSAAADTAPDPGSTPSATSVHASIPGNTTTSASTITSLTVFDSTLWSDLHLSSSSSDESELSSDGL